MEQLEEAWEEGETTRSGTWGRRKGPCVPHCTGQLQIAVITIKRMCVVKYVQLQECIRTGG